MSSQWQSAPQPAPGSYGGGGQSGPRAGFWIRLGALVLDALIWMIPIVIVIVVAIALDSPLLLGLAIIAASIGAIAYSIVMEGGPRGATLGKRICGIRLVDINTGGPIGYGHSTIRYLVRIVSGIPIYLGYLWMLWDPEKQTWHDKAAKCVVVPVDAYR